MRTFSKQHVITYVPVEVPLLKVGCPVASTPLYTAHGWTEADLSATTSSDDITSRWESCQGGPDGAAPLTRY